MNASLTRPLRIAARALAFLVVAVGCLFGSHRSNAQCPEVVAAVIGYDAARQSIYVISEPYSTNGESVETIWSPSDPNGPGTYQLLAATESCKTRRGGGYTASNSVTIPDGSCSSLSASGGGGMFQVDIPFSGVAVNATGGTPPYSFTFSGLPQGLTGSSNGFVSGTPTEIGTVNSFVYITDSNGCFKVHNFATIICPALRVSVSGVQDSQVGGTADWWFSASSNATAPISYAVQGMPPGLRLESGGHVTGTFTQEGSYVVFFFITDANGCPASVGLELTVGPANCSTLRGSGGGGTFAVDTPCSMTVTGLGGTPPYSFTFMSLPTGLTGHPNGTIDGTPTTVGTVSSVAFITDIFGCWSTHRFDTAITQRPTCTDLQVSVSGVQHADVFASADWQISASSAAVAPLHYAVQNLPPGLTLNPATGRITGTFTQPQTYDVIFTVTDANQCTGTHHAEVWVLASCGSLASSGGGGIFRVDAPCTMTVSGIGGHAPYSFRFTNLPEGLTGHPDGTITGTPTLVGTVTSWAYITDIFGCERGHRFETTITPGATCPTFSILTPASLPPATRGRVYSISLSATGAASPDWFITNPIWLQKDDTGTSNTTDLHGTVPTNSGDSVTFEAVYSDRQQSSCPGVRRTFTIPVIDPVNTCADSNIAVTGGGGEVRSGLPFESYFTVTGGTPRTSGYPYSYRVAGLPTGLALDDHLPRISGSSTIVGSHPITITAIDDNGCLGTSMATIVVLPALVCPTVTIITPSTLPTATRGAHYSFTLNATGANDPAFWVATPSWLVNAANGRSHTVTYSGTVPNDAPDTLIVESAYGEVPGNHSCATVRRTFTIPVIDAPACPTLTISDGGTTSANPGSAFQTTLTATGATDPTWVFSDQPSWLSITATNAHSRTLSGTVPANASGSYTVTVKYKDDLHPDCAPVTTTVTILIEPPTCRPLSINTTSLPVATAGTYYTATITGSGANRPNWGLRDLPAWMSVLWDEHTATIYGNVPANAPSSLTIGATYMETLLVSCPRAEKDFQLTILGQPCPTLSFVGGGGTSATPGSPFQRTIGASGATSPQWTVTDLPSWLTATGTSSHSITLSGTVPATATGSIELTLRYSDTSRPSCPALTTSLSIPIGPAVCPTLAVTTPSTLPAATRGSAYSFTLNGTGATDPSWWVSIPTWLIPDNNGRSNTVVYSGTVPMDAGSTISVEVLYEENAGDRTCPGVRRFLTIPVNAPACPTLSITGGGNSAATPGLPFQASITGIGASNPLWIVSGQPSWMTASGTTSHTLTLSGTVPADAIGSITLALSYGEFRPTGAAAETEVLAVPNQPACPAVTTGLNIFIDGPTCRPLAITTSSTLPAASRGSRYSFTLTGAGATRPAWNVTVPSWLTAEDNGQSNSTTYSGVVPNEVGAEVSLTAFYGESASGLAHCPGISAVLTIPVNAPACPTLAITTTELPVAYAGSSYTATLTGTGAANPAWDFNTLPTWLNVTSRNSHSVTLSGDVPADAPSSATVGAIYKELFRSCPPAATNFQISVQPQPCPTLTITTYSIPNTIEGTRYTTTLTAMGAVAPQWSFAGLPAWLTATGTSSQTVTFAGDVPLGFTGPITITATYSDSSRPNCYAVLHDYVLLAAEPVCPALLVNISALPAARVGIPYSAFVQVTGARSVHLNVTGRPAWLSISGEGTDRVTLSGIPTTPGQINLDFIYCDAARPACPTFTKTFTLVTEGVIIDRTPTHSVGNQVFFDANDNDRFDTGDYGLAGTVVQLYAADSTTPATDIDGTQVPVQTTGNDGRYKFSNLPAGDYVICVTPPTGHLPVLSTADPDTDIDHDSHATTARDVSWCSLPVTLSASSEPTNDGDDSTSNLTVDFGFRSTNSPITTWAQWQQANNKAQNGLTQNPDGDLFVNLLEYALGTDPCVGINNARICLERNATGGIDLVYTRAHGLTDLSFIVQGIARLADSPSAWANLGTVGTLTPDADGTDTIRVANINADSLFTGSDSGFVRLKVALGTTASAVTQTFGWCTRTFDQRITTFSQPFLQCEVFAGNVSSLTDTSLTISTQSGLKAKLALGVEYFIEVRTGESAGQRFEIDEATTTDTAIALDLQHERSTSKTIPATLQGNAIVLRAHHTVADLFSTRLFHGTTTPSTADRVLTFDKTTQRFKTLWLLSAPTSTRWLLNGDATLANQDSRVIDNGEGFFVQPRAATITTTFFGAVRANPFISVLATGSNMIGTGFPMDLTPNHRSLSTLNGFVGTTNPSSSDKFQLWQGDASASSSGYDSYFLLKTASMEKWLKQGDSTLTNQTDVAHFKKLNSVFIKTSRVAPAYSQPMPWSP